MACCSDRPLGCPAIMIIPATVRGRFGWSLSPLFDVNPNPFDVVESTPLRPGSSRIDRDVRVLLATADSYGLGQDDARRVLAEAAGLQGEVRQPVQGWMV